MNLAHWILEHLTPGHKQSRARLVIAMEHNAKETELLTDEIRKASFEPDKTQRLFVGANHRRA